MAGRQFMFLYNFWSLPKSANVVKSLEGWFYVTARSIWDPSFVSTHFHKNLDPEAEKIQFFNFGVSQGKPWQPSMDVIHEADKIIPEGVLRQPGGFAQVAVSDPAQKPTLFPYERPATSRFVVTAFQVPDAVPAEEFEANWKDWSGVSLLEKEAAPETGYAHSALYKKVSPMGDFRFVTRSEFSGLHDKHDDGMRLVGKVRERFGSGSAAALNIKSYSSLFKVAIDVHQPE
ncbi:Hypp289 [Branchiostoma lanceolatum]|uniref:Hypp289 protein n=1 Tax=Branchiostoma lanceolatum TaxID=7740 RepID=A0A8J9W330_BRALA|nr:Hypp289 [Branchiostoma lanceolatum]